uniref:Uncharacterized protein n=1 Tax=uncultured prokaryote TaxID=198431 RepID=A0A0H5Q1T5_9ZZZZ|nr:hypothetical protein [uncultured prokaryote]
MTQDRRLVLVVQGDEITTSYHMWLESPCDEHGTHVLANRLGEESGITGESAHDWLREVLLHASAELCLCGAQEASKGMMGSMLEATRG